MSKTGQGDLVSMVVLGFPFLFSIRHFPLQKKRFMNTIAPHLIHATPRSFNQWRSDSTCLISKVPVSAWAEGGGCFLFFVTDQRQQTEDGGVCFANRPFANWSNVLPLRVFKTRGLVRKDRGGQDGWETQRGLITVMNSFSASDVGQSVFYQGLSREELPGTSVRS